MAKVAFIGHRNISAPNIHKRLVEAIKEQIASGNTTFIMGTYGDFDAFSLAACRQVRQEIDINIEVTVTSLHKASKLMESEGSPYKDVKIKMYDIENIHFKQQITQSNRYMIDESEVLICYVNPNISKSGAKTTMKYAEKKGLRIINLHKENE